MTSMSRIVGGVISFFMNHFLLLTYVLFLVAGVVCAVISGLIEYRVFAELYKKVDESIPFYFSIPLLVVFALEVTKVFLVFFDKQATHTMNDAYMSDRGKFTVLRAALIVTSAVCTLVFSFYSLHNPEYAVRLGEKISDANADYQRRLQNLQREFSQRMQGINDEVKLWRERLAKEAQIVINGIAEGPRYKAYEKQYAEAVQRLDVTRNQLEQQRLQRTLALEQSHAQKIERLEEGLKSDRSVHNTMLAATLSVINMRPDYPQWQYIFMIVFLSGLVSLALECVIICSFTVLAIYHGDIFELGIHRKNSEQKLSELAMAADDLQEAEMKTLRKRILREKHNTVDTLKSVIDK